MVFMIFFDRVKDKDYFVITTNVDHCFQKAGFDKKRLFYTQGDYGLFQCSEPCCSETFDNEKIVRQMMEQQKDMRIPSTLLPKCPHCGKPLTMNLRADDTFVEDEGWHLAAERYQNFLRTRENDKVLFLELGVGYNTLGILEMSCQSWLTEWRCRKSSWHFIFPIDRYVSQYGLKSALTHRLQYSRPIANLAGYDTHGIQSNSRLKHDLCFSPGVIHPLREQRPHSLIMRFLTHVLLQVYSPF